jgi:ligand-binding sensor domain-containing protein
MRNILVMIFLSWAFISHAQYFPVRQYMTYDGMPSSSIYDIDQSPEGMMWFLSAKGPIYYGTRQWYSFADSLQLPKNQNSRISIDHEGNVWVAGLTDAHYQIFKFSDQTWHKVNQPQELSTFNNTFFAFSTLNATDLGAIVIGRDHDLYILQKESENWLTLQFEEETSIHSIRKTKDGHQWVMTNTGLYSLKNNEVNLISELSEKLPTKKFRSIVQFNNCYYLLGDSWLAKWQGATVELISTNIPSDHSSLLNKSNLCVDQRGRIFAGYNVPAHYFDPLNRVWKKLLIEGLELNVNSTRIFCDLENNLWIGDSRGLFKFNLIQFSNFNRNMGLGENEVSAIIELSDSTMVLANPHYINTIRNDTIRSFLIDKNLSQDFRILDLAEDTKRKLLYVATGGGGLHVYKIDQYQKPVHLFKSEHSFVSVESYQDKILAATTRQVLIMDENKTEVMFENGTFIRNLSVVDDQVMIDLIYDGIIVISDDEITRFKSTNKGFSSVYNTIKYNDQLLLSTKNGIAVVENHEIVPWNQFDMQIPCYGLFEDKQNHLWIGTGQGIFKLEGKETTHFGVPQGLIGFETNRNAFMEDSKGNIWIGMEKGASLFKGNQSNLPYYLANVEIISTITNKGSHLDKTKINRLEANENTVSIDYQCLSYVREQDLQLRFQLYDPNEPEQAVWENITNEGSSELRFSNLSPGPYVFRIQARNQGYDWGEVREVKWIIRQPFYNQLWFIFLTGILALAMLWLIFHLRFMLLIRRQRNLKKMVDLRTKEIQELNESLEDKVAERTRLLKERNQQLREYAFINAHLLRSPLTRIMSVLLLLREEKPRNLSEEYLTLLEESTSELDEVIHSINNALSDENEQEKST